MVLHLQNFNIIRIFVPQIAKIEHHAGKYCLDRLFFIAAGGEGQGDTSLLVLDPDLGLCTANIVDGGLGHGDNGGDGGANDVAACLTVAAVAGDGESSDSFVFHKKFASSHILITERSW